MVEGHPVQRDLGRRKSISLDRARRHREQVPVGQRHSFRLTGTTRSQQHHRHVSRDQGGKGPSRYFFPAEGAEIDDWPAQFPKTWRQLPQPLYRRAGRQHRRTLKQLACVEQFKQSAIGLRKDRRHRHGHGHRSGQNTAPESWDEILCRVELQEHRITLRYSTAE